MRRVTSVISAAALVLMTAALLAQAKPNFAGKWTVDPTTMTPAPAAPAAGAPAGGGGGGRGGGRGGGGGLGMELTITQDATSVTIEYTQGQNPVKFVYKTDGSAGTNSVMGRGGAAVDTPYKAVWAGSTLVVTTTTANGDQKRVFSMAGANLKVETTNPGANGAAGTTSSVEYKKSM